MDFIYSPQTIESVSWAGVFALILLIPVRMLMPVLIAKMSKTDISAHARLEKIEHNDLTHVVERLGRIEGDIGDIRERLAVVETLIRK